ncbi:ribosomal protein L6e-domain-containing protein [Blyttiomyces helicus]|uniref:Ribosomal protein L6e-domain-containing protein n=1 Tax=Blyttiomyces helicus TaxID=388810 RepID=A0A4V1IQA4_9FUNG|nr:ribosomal protein L6e-domain-containing protein [Blyttiomyces helicus]|eukprot:RKO85867.1 ribosomal protein L6e-domain-containing protein [Blyttiomyces helicus]
MAHASEIQTKTKTVGGAKNGGSRVVPVVKAPRFYATEDVVVKKTGRKVAKTAALRKTITPGTVLIVLSGRYRGKRVVFLKQLASGLLLVTGPYAINGVPIRRINQAYVIATSTTVDISGVTVDPKIDDKYFKRAAAGPKAATEEELFAQRNEKKTIDGHRVTDQKALDKQLLAVVKKTPLLKAYLKSSFALSKGVFPHNLKF